MASTIKTTTMVRGKGTAEAMASPGRSIVLRVSQHLRLRLIASLKQGMLRRLILRLIRSLKRLLSLLLLMLIRITGKSI
jgi:hypothetical protein